MITYLLRGKIHRGTLLNVGGSTHGGVPRKNAMSDEIFYELRCSETSEIHKISEINIISGKHIDNVNELVAM